MKSNHKHVEYVRQLDKTALKNCMELALLRHEKELSVKQHRNEHEVDRFIKKVEEGRILGAREKMARLSQVERNRKNLTDQTVMKYMQDKYEQEKEKNDIRVEYGPVGLTSEQEREIERRKREQARHDL